MIKYTWKDRVKSALLVLFPLPFMTAALTALLMYTDNMTFGWALLETLKRFLLVGEGLVVLLLLQLGTALWFTECWGLHSKKRKL